MDKIEDDKLYQGKIIKRMFDEAAAEVTTNPTGPHKKGSVEFQLQMSLSAIVLFHELKAKMFEKIEGDNENE